MKQSLHPSPSTDAAFCGNAEPALEDVLRDPIIRQVMDSDHVDDALLKQLQAHMEALAQRLATSSTLQ